MNSDLILHGFIWGILLGLVGMTAISLSDYLKMMQSEEYCKKCDRLADCFAKKPFGKRGLIRLDEFMVVSFFRVHRKCQLCHKTSVTKIFYYLFVSCVLTMVLFWSKGTGMTTVLYCVIMQSLLMLSVVDWNTQYIPLECNIIIFICGLIQLFADVSNWLEYVIGLIAVSGFLFLVNKIATPILKNKYEEQDIDRVIGDGDIKLMAATGLALGWKLNFIALGIGCIAGSVIHLILMKVKGSDRQFALGPYLSLGVYITMICGEQLISWYLSMMGVVPVH